MTASDGFGGGFVAALVGHGAGAEAAVALAGGRIGERVAWGALPADTAAVLLVEAEGVDDATLSDALPGLSAVCAARDLPLVVAFALSQIDVVAAALLDGDAVLLCEPAIGERVVAIAVAAGGRAATTRVREGEGERLRRLNAEVARIAAQLAALVEPDDAGVGVADRRMTFAPPPPDEVAISAADIRRTIRARRLRAQFFDARLLEDPGWDMLLDLFAAAIEGRQVSVSSLCIASGVAPTTALRWIGRMADARLLVRVPDADDRRRAFLELSPGAAAAMRAYAVAARRAGLPIA